MDIRKFVVVRNGMHWGLPYSLAYELKEIIPYKNIDTGSRLDETSTYNLDVVKPIGYMFEVVSSVKFPEEGLNKLDKSEVKENG